MDVATPVEPTRVDAALEMPRTVRVVRQSSAATPTGQAAAPRERRHVIGMRQTLDWGNWVRAGRATWLRQATPLALTNIDPSVIGVTLLLLVPGLLILQSASSVTSYATTRDSAYYLSRQLRMLVLGAVGAGVVAAIDYHRLAAFWRQGLVATVAVLVLVLSGLGQSANGAQRWVAVFGYQLFQPGELIKPVLIVTTAAYLTQQPGIAARFREGLGGFGVAYAVIVGLLMLQPDMGTAGVVVLTGFTIYLVAGARPLHVVLAIGGGAAAGAALVVAAPYRLARWTTFLDPWASAQGTGYHVVQSLLALGAGGIAGVGAGVSRQKFFFLPFPHTDSIFAVLGEEFGLVGTVTTVLAFMAFMWRGMRVASRAPDALGTCIAAGATMGIVFQALINMLVLTSSVPFTGITLPFFSYGGSSMVASCVMCGLILAVSRQIPRDTSSEGHRSWRPTWRRQRSGAPA